MYYYGQGVAKDEKRAFALWSKLAARGNTVAQISLALMCYVPGKGVRKNLPRAAKLLATAAEQGDSFAQFYLGDFYYNGCGVPQDFDKALALWTESAKNGNVEAQERLKECAALGDKARNSLKIPAPKMRSESEL